MAEVKGNEDFILIDVSIIGEKFAEYPRYKKFIRTIKQLESINVSISDLRVAKECLDLMLYDFGVEVEDKVTKQDSREARVRGALFTEAVIAYSRATETTSEEKVKPGIIDKFSREQRKNHKEIMNIRNGAFAHYGSAEENWASCSVVFKISRDSSLELFVPHGRDNYRGDFARKFLAHIDESLLLAYQIDQDKREKLINANNELQDFGREKKLELSEIIFDPGKIFSRGANIGELFQSGNSGKIVTKFPSSYRNT